MGKAKAGKYTKNMLYSVIALFAFALIILAVARVYITTPHAASFTSRLVSNSLDQDFTLKSIAVYGGTLQLKGISLANPDSFHGAKLLEVDSISIKPEWLKLFSKNRVIEQISMDGVRIGLSRNSSGSWNFNTLQKRFATSKQASGEMFVHELSISNGTINVEGHQLKLPKLNISKLATKGSQTAKVLLEFYDPGSNHYLLAGSLRPGDTPQLDIALTSSAISLKPLYEALKPGSTMPANGKASLRLTAVLDKGLFQTKASLPVSLAAGQEKQLDALFTLALNYNLQSDLLTIEKASAELDNLAAVHFSGKIQDLKKSRDFSIDLHTGEVDLARLARFLPVLKSRQIKIGGRLDKSLLHLSGSVAGGMKSARGTLNFRQGLLAREGQIFFDDLSFSAVPGISEGKLIVSGNILHPRSTSGSLLEQLNAPYTITANSQLKIIRMAMPELNAKISGTSVSGSAGYFNGAVSLEKLNMARKDAKLRVGRLSAQLPASQVSNTTMHYPLVADISDCELSYRDAQASGISGKAGLAYAYKPDSKWLEGTATVNIGKISINSREVGTARIDTVFDAAGGKADLKASLLGGDIQGSASFNPFTLSDKVSFAVRADGIRLPEAGRLVKNSSGLSFASGTINATGKGSHSLSGGLTGQLGATGSNVTITGKGGKSLLSGGSLEIDSRLSGQRLELQKAQFFAGNKVTATLNGMIDNLLSPERQGKLNFDMPRSAVADIADSIVNALPRQLQEATLEGHTAVKGTVTLKNGSTVVDGRVTLENIQIDSPSSKIKVAGINGTLPLSLDLSGRSGGKMINSLNFNRQNYDNLFTELRRQTPSSEIININSIAFSGININHTRLGMFADRGVTSITSLESSMYGGTILGKGLLTIQGGLVYRGDMLFNNLSLVQICNSFPAIAGYLSGKADGIISIRANGSKYSDLTGFTEFWSRETEDEKMLVSKEFLQKLSGKKLSSFFFSSDRAFDHAGIKASLEKGFLTFDSLDISNTNMFGVRDLSVTIATSQNRISIEHLLNSIREATERGKEVTGNAPKEGQQPAALPTTEFKWDE
jgi:hypothetical protein